MKKPLMCCVMLMIWLAGALQAQGVMNFAISEGDDYENYPATAYNFQEEEFLVVWTDYRLGHADIFGCFVLSTGAPKGPSFPVFTQGSSEITPDVAYNRIDNEYLVVWTDWRREENGGPDIFGIRLDKDGQKILSVDSEPDTSFAICKHDSSQAHAKVAHNYVNNTYLVVWQDDRNNYPYGMPTENLDIYGQRVDRDGTLLPPHDPAGPAVNFLVHSSWDYDDHSPDVAYHGSLGTELNEWLVVWSREMTSGSDQSTTRVWGSRVKGNTGWILDTQGHDHEPFQYTGTAKTSQAMLYDFVIGFDGYSLWGEMPFVQGSPHNISNGNWEPDMLKAAPIDGADYPIPEFLVAWTDFRLGWDNPDIFAQRVAYFPDSTAFRLGLKDTREADSLFTCVLLDTAGNWPANPADWITWPNYPVTTHGAYQSWNELAYNQTTGEYLVVWNDWRADGHSGYPLPQADIYGQFLYLDPADSSLIWKDETGQRVTDRSVNTPIANGHFDEGNSYYPCIGHAHEANMFFMGYEMDLQGDNTNSDIYGTTYPGTPPLSPVEPGRLPLSFRLDQNRPNPFNPSTQISFYLPRSEHVTIQVFDLMGRQVATLLENRMNAGENRVIWDGRDATGHLSASGVYVYRVKAGSRVMSKKMILMR